MYFSFTTQTTVGFGDFVPGTDVGRALAAGQAVVGQMYLVTVVAVVISQLGRRPRRRGGGEPQRRLTAKVAPKRRVCATLRAVSR